MEQCSYQFLVQKHKDHCTKLPVQTIEELFWLFSQKYSLHKEGCAVSVITPGLSLCWGNHEQYRVNKITKLTHGFRANISLSSVQEKKNPYSIYRHIYIQGGEC